MIVTADAVVALWSETPLDTHVGMAPELIQSTPLVSGLRERLTKRPIAVQWHGETGEPAHWSGAELWTRAERWLHRLAADGLASGDRVAVMAAGTPEWLALDLALFVGGYVAVPIHPDASSAMCRRALETMRPQLLVVGDQHQATRALTVADSEAMPNAFVALTPVAFDDARIVHWCSAQGATASVPDEVPAGAAALYLDDSTEDSDTMGRSIAASRAAFERAVDSLTRLGAVGDGQLLHAVTPVSLPLTRTVVYAALLSGAAVAFLGAGRPSLDGVRRQLQQLSPDVLLAPPRLLEFLHTEWAERASRAGGLPELLYNSTVRAGTELTQQRERTRRSELAMRMRFTLTYRLFGRRLREQLGGRLSRVLLPPGAIAISVARCYLGLGIDLMETFGVPSAAGLTHANRPGGGRFGMGISPLPDVVARMGDEQLIELSGGHVEAPDTWVSTGCVGRVVDGEPVVYGPTDAVVRVIDGKPISATRLEARLTASPYINRAIVFGDGREFLSALLTLNPDSVSRWLREHGIVSRREDELARHPLVYGLIDAVVNEVNSALPSYETIRKIAILERDFSWELGELTASMELRRSAIAARHELIVESFYREQY